MTELIPRIATALHVFNHSMVQLLAGTTATPPSSKILAETLENATAFVKHLECQKDIIIMSGNLYVFAYPKGSFYTGYFFDAIFCAF